MLSHLLVEGAGLIQLFLMNWFHVCWFYKAADLRLLAAGLGLLSRSCILHGQQQLCFFIWGQFTLDSFQGYAAKPGLLTQHQTEWVIVGPMESTQDLCIVSQVEGPCDPRTLEAERGRLWTGGSLCSILRSCLKTKSNTNERQSCVFLCAAFLLLVLFIRSKRSFRSGLRGLLT